MICSKFIFPKRSQIGPKSWFCHQTGCHGRWTAVYGKVDRNGKCSNNHAIWQTSGREFQTVRLVCAKHSNKVTTRNHFVVSNIVRLSILSLAYLSMTCCILNRRNLLLKLPLLRKGRCNACWNDVFQVVPHLPNHSTTATIEVGCCHKVACRVVRKGIITLLQGAVCLDCKSQISHEWWDLIGRWTLNALGTPFQVFLNMWEDKDTRERVAKEKKLILWHRDWRHVCAAGLVPAAVAYR